MGRSTVAVTKSSDITPILSKKFLEIKSTMKCWQFHWQTVT